jgi:hypothetical protein
MSALWTSVRGSSPSRQRPTRHGRDREQRTDAESRRPCYSPRSALRLTSWSEPCGSEGKARDDNDATEDGHPCRVARGPAGCPSCSAIADGFNGFEVHRAHHDVMPWAMSRAPLAKLQAYEQQMGWTFPSASSFESDFNDG